MRRLSLWLPVELTAVARAHCVLVKVVVRQKAIVPSSMSDATEGVYLPESYKDE